MADARRKLDIGLESGPLGSSRIHDSAPKHVAGEALYIDDIAAPEGLLHAYLGTSTITHGRLLSLNLDAVRAAPGVGEKIADCVLLFGYHRLSRFPRDVWINRVLEREYPAGFPAERYAGCEGLMQQYLFYYARSGERAGRS